MDILHLVNYCIFSASMLKFPLFLKAICQKKQKKNQGSKKVLHLPTFERGHLPLRPYASVVLRLQTQWFAFNNFSFLSSSSNPFEFYTQRALTQNKGWNWFWVLQLQFANKRPQCANSCISAFCMWIFYCLYDVDDCLYKFQRKFIFSGSYGV